MCVCVWWSFKKLVVPSQVDSSGDRAPVARAQGCAPTSEGQAELVRVLRPALSVPMNENEAPQVAPAARAAQKAPDAATAPCTHHLADAGISRDAATGGYLIANSLEFRASIERVARQAGTKTELLAALNESWSSDPKELRLALQPTRCAGTEGEGVKDSLVRLLLHCK